jgi:hypothetical protein
MTLQYFFNQRTFFFGYRLEDGRIKKLGESGGKRCMYIEDWFKPIFPFLLCKFKFLIPVADSSPPPPHPSVISQVMPIAFNIILPL